MKVWKTTLLVMYPSQKELKQLFKNYQESLKKAIVLKIRDSNKMKSNYADPHLRTLALPDVHRLVFETTVATKFKDSEKNEDVVDSKNSSPNYSLSSISRINEVFPNAVIRVHSSGDITLVTPWYVLNREMNIHENVFAKGALVLPVEQGDNAFKCFIPCAGLDPDTNLLPSWCESYSIRQLVPDLNPMELYPIRRPGIGKLVALRGTEHGTIPSGQIEESDIIYSRGQWMEVYAYGDDAFYREGTHNSIRFKQDVSKNINKQKFDIMKWPIVQGKIVELDANVIDSHEFVSIVLNKINDQNIGNLKIVYRNACFNSLGFLTHDTYIVY